MKFFIDIYKTALHMAVEKENVEIVQLLILSDKLDVNRKSIKNNYF